MDHTKVLDGAREVLVAASFAWKVSETWTAVVVWLVWWPAWFAGAVVLASGLFSGGGGETKEEKTASGSTGDGDAQSQMQRVQ